MSSLGVFVLLVCGASASTACTHVSSTPLENSRSNATTDRSAPCANAPSSSGRDAEGALGSAQGMDAQGASNDPTSLKSTGDTRFGVHKPGDDTRVNSGAGQPTPLDATGRGAP